MGGDKPSKYGWFIIVLPPFIIHKKNIYPSKIVIFHSYVSLPRGNPLKSLDFSIPNATQVAHLAPGVSPGLLRSRPRHR